MYRNIIYFLSLFILTTNICYARDFPVNNEFTVEERLNCAIQAGLKYNVPVDVLLAISSIENGNIDTISKNTNNTYDYGVMQINSDYIQDLNQTAAYKLKDHIKFDKGDLLTRLAMYHSKTPKYNEIYKKKIVFHSKYWSDFLLKNNFKLYLYSEIQ